MSQFLGKVVGRVVFRKTCYDCMLLIIEDLRQGCLKLYTSFNVTFCYVS